MSVFDIKNVLKQIEAHVFIVEYRLNMVHIKHHQQPKVFQKQPNKWIHSFAFWYKLNDPSTAFVHTIMTHSSFIVRLFVYISTAHRI